MAKSVKYILALLKYLFFIPHFLLYKFHPNNKIIHTEFKCWVEKVLYLDNYSDFIFFKLISSTPEYRNVFYLRLGSMGTLLKIIIPGCKTFTNFNTSNTIGLGLILHHPICTRISCKGIGENCQIWQMVIIGKSKPVQGLELTPLLKNNVKVSAGAIILGDIVIGNNVTIGAGAVVSKSIPDNCVVIGNPAFIIKRNGMKVYEKL